MSFDFFSLLPGAQSFIQSLLSNTIVVGVIAWLAKLWADRRIEAFKADQNQKIEQLKGAQALKIEEIKGAQTSQLESLKGEVANLGRSFQAGIEKRMLVFKTHFDVEFKAYQEIWMHCDVAVDTAAMTLGFVQRVPVDKKAAEEEGRESIRRYDLCRESLAEVRRKRPFVTPEIGLLSKDVLRKCVEITDLYKGVYPYTIKDSTFDRKSLISEIKIETDSLGEMYDQLSDAISARLSELYVSNS